MNSSFLYYITVISLLFSVLCHGQIQFDKDYPKVYPSSSDDFSYLKSFPSVCINNVHVDELGRYWLSTCGSSAQIDLHLFKFDGYNFSIVDEPFKDFGFDKQIISYLGDNKLAGLIIDNIATHLFILDLDLEEIKLFDLPSDSKLVSYDRKPSEKLTFVFENNSQFEIYTFKDEKFELVREIPNITIEYDKKRYAVFNDSKYIWQFQKSKNLIKRFDIESGDNHQFKLQDFVTQYPDFYNSEKLGFHIRKTSSNDQLVVNTPDGLLVYEFDNNKMEFRQINSDNKLFSDYTVYYDDSGNTMLFYRYPNEEFKAILLDNEGQTFDYSAFFPNGVVKNIKNLIGSDFKKSIIECTRKGITIHTVKEAENIRSILPGKSIRSIAELSSGQLFVQQQSKDKVLFDPVSESFDVGVFPHFDSKYESAVVDSERNCWVIHVERTENISNDFLLKFDSDGKVLEKHYLGKDNFKYFSFFSNKSKVVLISNKGKMAVYNLLEKVFETTGGAYESYLDNVFIHDIIVASNDVIWIATTNGLISYDIDKNTVKSFGKNSPFVDFRFLCLLEDAQERIWAGTSLGGLHIYNPQNDSLIVLNSNQGLANNTVVSIVEDDSGMKWIGTYNGVSLISDQGKLVRNFYPEDGVANKESNRFSCHKGADGKIFIGSVDGLTIIDPVKVKSKLGSNNDLSIYLTQVEYFDYTMEQNITVTKGLTNDKVYVLPAAQKDIKLNFALSNYINVFENKYEYTFDIHSGSWIDLGNQNQLNLKNLPSGNYSIFIRGADVNGNKSQAPLEVRINAKEYIHKQTWFTALLVFGLLGLAFLWVQRLKVEVNKATNKIENDKKIIESQARKLKELDVAKTKFFTNISHEFRTPLTIISGTTDLIKSKPEEWLEKGTEMINQNAQNLLDLINQILDLRKLETNTLSLNLIKGNIVEYLSYILDSYKVYAHNSNVNLHFLNSADTIVMDYDPDKMLRIISNLLTNAIKYNKTDGDVYLQVDPIGDNSDSSILKIKIRDTGLGIPEDKIKLIFERFYQANEPGERKVSGSGIGLSLTKELVELMGGQIGVSSIEGRGTTFEINLPITRNSEVMDASLNLEEVSHTIISEDQDINNGVQTNTDLSETILIVEDNPQIINILKSSLQDEYKIESTIDGQKGIELALEVIPDLIISDVMMPDKSGFELCDTLKRDERTSHVPIILLTAKTDDSSKIQGLKLGADAYISKPFNQQELNIRIKNLLEVRKKMQQRYLAISEEGQMQEDGSLSTDDLFMLKLNKIINENMTDENFGILHLVRQIGLSRSQLHNKIKALTGLSTSIYIRSLRLKKALELLKTTERNISEVAYDVGFKSPAYFSNAFIKEFGYAPSKTRK